jgi:hypothetical protein
MISHGPRSLWREAIRHANTVFLVVAVVVLTAWLLHSCEQSRVRERDRVAARTTIERAALEDLANVVTTHQAITDWESKICNGSSVRIDTVFSIDLERVWLVDRPILFAGSIRDVSTSEHGDSYDIVIDQSYLRSCITLTDLRLSLRCPKTLVDAFLAKKPETRTDIRARVAVVADIESVTTEKEADADGSKHDVRVGVGACRDLVDVSVLRRRTTAPLLARD